MPPHLKVQLSTSDSGSSIGPSSERVVRWPRVKGEQWLCPWEDIFGVNEVENSRVKQGHGPGEAFREGSPGRQPRTRGSPLIGRAA